MHIQLEALKKRLYVENQVKNIKFFPGSSADADPESMAAQINKFFAADSSEEVLSAEA